MRPGLPALALALAGCASGPPPADWQLASRAALEEGVAAELRGDSRIAALAFERARREIARSGRPALQARAELLRCATGVASLQFGPCDGFERLRPDADPAELAYAAHLAGQAGAAQQVLLPPAQQALGTVRGDADGAAALQAQADPLSRLVGAAVLLQTGRAGPAVAALATETASAQGWRRPLLAWLGLQLRLARQAGHTDAAERLQRRIDLVGGG